MGVRDELLALKAEQKDGRFMRGTIVVYCQKHPEFGKVLAEAVETFEEIRDGTHGSGFGTPQLLAYLKKKAELMDLPPFAVSRSALERWLNNGAYVP